MSESIAAPPSRSQEATTGFVRELGLLDSTMIVAGSMIGSGIFIVPAEIARQVGSAGWLIMVWVVTGLLTVAAALSYGELAAMMPKAGGHDAESGRPVRLPARGLLATLGVPLRLGPVPGDPDGHHRRGRRGVRPLPGSALPGGLPRVLDPGAGQAVGKVRDQPLDPAARGHPADH